MALGTGTFTIVNTINSTSTDTGALQVYGGVGIGGNLYVGGEIVAQKLTIEYTTITTTIVETDDIITTFNSSSSTSTTTGALVVAGGVGIGGDVYVGGDLKVSGALVVTTASISSSAVTSITAGTDTAVSGSVGSITIWNTSTLQTITNRGNSTTNAVLILNTDASTSTTTGALQVRGGAAIGEKLFVGSDANINGSLTLAPVIWSYLPTTFTNIPVTYGATHLTFTLEVDDTITNMSVAQGAGGYGPGSVNLVIPGTTFPGGTSPANDIVFDVQTFFSPGPVYSTDVTSTVSYVSGTLPSRYDSIKSTGNVGIGAENSHWTFGTDGVLTLPDAGLITSVSNGVNIYPSSGQAAVISNFSGYNQLYAWDNNVSIQTSPNNAGATFNTWVFDTDGNLTNPGAVSVLSSVNSTSSTTGALTVAGGVGVELDMYVGGTIYSNNSQVVTFANTASLISSNAGFASTSGFALSFNTGTLVNVAVSASTSNFATTSGFALSFNTGTLVNIAIFASSSTYANVAGIANNLGTGTYAIVNSTASTSTDTGALIVVGGVGIGGDAYVGGNLTVKGALVITTASISSSAVTSVTAGTDTAVSASIGSITIWNTSTLETVTGRGNSTTNAILITNITDSTGTDSGALQVVGGGGIGGNLYVGGDLYQRGAQVVTTATIQNLTSSTLADITQRGATTPDAIRITNTSNSTSTVTGALVVTGGAGIGGNVNIGGGLIASGINFLNKNQHIWYVDPVIGLDDYTKNGHPLSPARTIKYALIHADSGDTVFIQPGTYYEEFPLTINEGVSVRGAGLREVLIYPTTATNTATAFLLNGEALISDFTVGGFFKPGYAFEFAPGAVTTTKSPYIERFSVITKGSVTSASDPYGFNSNNAGGGVKIDGARVATTSVQASMMFNEATFIVPNATGLYMTNGARAEVINTFFYFADKAIHAVTSSTGYAGAGKTKLKLGGVGGTLTAGDTLFYKTSGGDTLASGTIASVDGSYVYITGAQWGFDTPSTRTAKIISVLGDVSVDTSVKKYGTGSAKFDGVGDGLTIPSSSDFGFGTGDFTIEGWFYHISNATQDMFEFRVNGTSQAAISLSYSSSNLVLTVLGSARITGTSALPSNNTWYHVVLMRASGNTMLYVNGARVGSTWADSTNYITAPLFIGTRYDNTIPWNGYIDDIRISKGIAKYSTSSFVTPTQALTTDEYTVLMLHANGALGSTVFTDDNVTPQVIYSTGTTYASATSIELADYHQFGAEIRSLGSAAIFGNSGVTADGTGTDIKLIGFNLSHIGSGKDSTDDISLVVQSNEIIQLNNGRVYFQTVDQSGDFRVGNSFLVNQKTGDVSFGDAKVNLSNVSQLTITDGVNSSVILPTSVSVGSLVLSGGSLVTNSGNLTLDPAGTLTTINSDLHVNGTASISGITDISNQSASTSTTTGALIVSGGVGIGQNLYVGGALYQQGQQVLTTASVNQFANQTSITAGTDIAVSTSTGNITISNTSTLQTVTGRGNSTTNTILILNATAAGSTNSGALQIVGGVGIGQDLYVGGSLYQNGQQVLTTASVNQFANQTSITAGTDIAVSTSTGNITISNTSTLQTVTGRGATTTNAISVTNATIATSTNSGALQVVGGVGIGGNLYVGGEIVAQKLTIQLTTVTTTEVTTDDIISTYNTTNATSTNSGALQVAGGAGIGGNLYVGSTIYSSGNVVLTTATVNQFANQTSISAGVGISVNTSSGNVIITNIGVTTATGSTYIGISTSSGNVLITNLGVTNLSSGTDITLSATTGSIIINDVSTLQSITGRGATTTNVVSFTSTTTSTSTATGAVVITGGLGVGGQINATSIVAGGVRSTTGSNSPADPTVGDMWYNTTNDRLYRYTANGVINFWLDYTGPVVQYLNNF